MVINVKIHSKIKQALETNRLIFFVGSGFSKELGFSDWKELLSSILSDLSTDYDFCKLLKENLDTEMMDTLEVLKKLEKKELKPTILNKLETYFTVSSDKREYLENNSTKYKKITDITKKIITTNYDEIIEIANGDIQKFTYDNKYKVAKLHELDNFIYKLHGCIEDPTKCVLFAEEYDLLYTSNSPAIEELKKLIADNTVIFLGFSLKDEFVKKQFDYIYSIYKGLKGNHFIVSTDNHMEKIEGIEKIQLDSWDKIEEFLESLYEIKLAHDAVSVTSIPVEKDLEKKEFFKPRFNVLFAEPFNSKNNYNKNKIIKAFNNYDIDLTIDVLSINKLNNIENFDYLFLFTEAFNNKILVEDDYLNSTFITLNRFEEEIFADNLKGVFIFSKKLYTGDEEVSLTYSYIINKFNEQNFNSMIFQILRKNKINENETIIINEDKLIIPQINRGKCTVYEKHSYISSEIDSKNLLNFVGRLSDLETITRKIQDLDGRLLSIKASGGIGKTTIVKKIAFELSRRNYFKDGIIFIDCEFISDIKAFQNKISHSFEIDHTNNLVDYLSINNGKRDLLLILDNFESLLYLSDIEHTYSIKKLVTFLCDFCSIVVTTRELLGLEFEEFYDLRPLTTDEAEKLFFKNFKSEVNDVERKILRESVLENLLNNNPLAIKIVTSNIPNGKKMKDLKKDLEIDFFKATNLYYEDIFDEKKDLNIERSKSIFNSINYSYSLLPHREKLIFELLSLFPDGIEINNFKNFFESNDYKRDLSKFTDKDIKSLENKSLIENSNSLIKLQSIVGRFARYKFQNRSKEEQESYYSRAFELNAFILKVLKYKTKTTSNFYKFFDKYVNNFIEAVKFIPNINIQNKYKILEYIAYIAEPLHLFENKRITPLLEDLKPLLTDIENGCLLIDIYILNIKYFHGEFEEAIISLEKILPLESIFELLEKGSTHNENVTNKKIISLTLNLYSFKNELKVLDLAIKSKFPLERSQLQTIFFKLGLDNYLDNIAEESEFFHFEIQNRKGKLEIDKLQNFIDQLFSKEFIELVQTNYIKAKQIPITKKEVFKLVSINPYTDGLKNIMLAFIEDDFDSANNYYLTALSNLKHINYYYLEAVLYYVKFLEKHGHPEYEKWLQLGYNQTKNCGYQYLFNQFILLSKEYSKENVKSIEREIIDYYLKEIMITKTEKPMVLLE
ncbi:SIR2 family protein [Sutcliffiella rhizosphaerae]|uniref:SIR2-like domain-containing protein n=1 Tax=Sutcliffiella rhizosphaerae TaxID=2880967 RepID=A0ABM8YS18_9BACI|nr:SIR2 family protein [Sutcliffiella rhizosphaerae]CAG9622793.1 hypothetical protein BACCIP111883_03584 [Sutcliffiella rhizosphaerae]